MNNENNVLIVGLGSPFGDDQAGWRVAERLAARLGDRATVRCARSPAELLDWLGGVKLLVIIDACQTGAPFGQCHRLDWPIRGQAPACLRTSHDLGLLSVLGVAAETKQLPDNVVLWGIEVAPASASSAPNQPLSDAVQRAVAHTADRISGELCHA